MTRTGRALFWASQSVVIGVVVWLMLGGTRLDVHVPLALNHDAVFTIAQARATRANGWWWTNPDLGARSQDDPVLRPQAAHVDQLLLRIVGSAIPDPIRAVSATWLLMLMLAGASATWCLNRLGVSGLGAWCAGVLFALCPFALERNLTYMGLTPYLVPFAVTAALMLANGETAGAHPRRWAPLLAGNLLLALNAVYFALAGVVLIAVGTVTGAIRTRNRMLFAAGTGLVAIVGIVTLVNAGPALTTRDAVYPESTFRDAANAESYGLKLRHLITPLDGHWFGPFRMWTAADTLANFPDETQSASSRLGAVATAGFLGLIVVLLLPAIAGDDRSAPMVRTASQLVFAATLIATVGGFGAVFAELVTPHIRVFARMTPFIAFLSLVGVALTLDRLTRRHEGLGGALWAVVLMIGLFDQSLAVRPLVAGIPSVTADYRELRKLIDDTEAALPAGALVFQLPVRPFPFDPGLDRMASLDTFRPQIVSRGLRWSYPALSSGMQRLQEEAAATPLQDLPALLADRGVAAFVFDRFGYGLDGNRILGELQAVPGTTQVLVTTPRYVAMAVSKKPGPAVHDPAPSLR